TGGRQVGVARLEGGRLLGEDDAQRVAGAVGIAVRGGVRDRAGGEHGDGSDARDRGRRACDGAVRGEKLHRFLQVGDSRDPNTAPVIANVAERFTSVNTSPAPNGRAAASRASLTVCGTRRVPRDSAAIPRYIQRLHQSMQVRFWTRIVGEK